MSDRVDDNPDYSDEDINSSNESLGTNDQVKIKEDLITYTADQLFALREVALSTEWPTYLDEAFKNNRGQWDPDRWHQNKKRGSTPPPEEKAGTAAKDDPSAIGNKKKDIKDRLYAETEGIVLSPQRRSFITGCQVSKESTKESETPSNSGSTTGGGGGSTKPEPNLSLRPDSISNSARRVGSGRILSRDRPNDFDHEQRYNEGSSDRYGFNRNRDNRDRGRGNWYGRDFDQTRGGGSGRGGRSGAGRGMNDRSMNSRKNDSRSNTNRRSNRDSQPEWMDAPVNQDETFELRGFEDSPVGEPEPEPQIHHKKLPVAAPTSKPDQSSLRNNNALGSSTNNAGDQAFNIDDILHMGVIPGLANILEDHEPNMENERNVRGGKAESGGGSRFSQFFAKQPEQPQHPSEQRRSSIIDELGTSAATESFLQDFIQKQHQEQQQQTRIKIPSPGDPSAYFAPISPAAKTESAPPINPIMEMLRKGDDSDMPPLSHLKGMSEVKTAEEIEANIKHLVGLQREEPMNEPKPPTHPEGEMSAFKKFAAMVQGADDPGEQPPNGNHMTHGHQYANPEHHRVMRPNAPVIRPSPIPANAPTEQEILAEMAHRQREQLRMPIHGGPPGGHGGPIGPGGPGGHGPGGIQPSKEDVLFMISQRRLNPDLLKTQEAVSLQTAVQTSGFGMLDTFLYQFVYGQMEPQKREVLLQVIKMYQLKGAYGPQYQQHGPSQHQPPPHLQPPMHDPHHHHPSGLSPTSPTPGVKNLAVSPIPGRDRVPSPQEMAIHAQNIMQNALIKRKLEEQKENYRRRQEQDQMRKATESPLFAFTPTVVVERMAADRRDSDPKPAIPELKVSTSSVHAVDQLIGTNQIPQPMPQRGTSPGSPRLPPSSNISQQQMIFMQQQQIRAQQIAAAMQAGAPNMDPRMLMQAQAMMGHVGPRPIPPHSVPHGHHAPYLPPSQQHHPGAPGTGQLSQFFSPEVLAQAQAGNAPPLPPLPTQKAMTLEEIERQAATVRI